MQSRLLHWPTCYNVRDLGGLSTMHGEQTRIGAIVRSDVPTRLTIDGQHQLFDYGIRTIIDLRRPAQVAAEVPFSLLLDYNMPLSLHNISLEQHDATVDRLIAQAGKDRAAVYRLTVDHNGQAVAQIMRAIAAAPPGGILIHCNAGKDRTGIISALLLALAGVPDTVIAADYALSQEQLWPLYEALVAEAGGEAQVGWWLKPLATPAIMHNLLDYLGHRYGGVVEYLHCVGLSDAVIKAIRHKLLASSPQEFHTIPTVD